MAFKKDLVKRNQAMLLSRVGVHEKNGVAERAIQIVVTSSQK